MQEPAKNFFRILLAVILSALLALVLAIIIGLFAQSAALAAFLFLPLFGVSLWRSLKIPSTSKAAGKLLGFLGVSLLLVPVAILIAVIALVAGGFGRGSGYVGGALALMLFAVVVGGFIIFVPMGVAGSILGIVLRRRRSEPGDFETPDIKVPDPSIDRNR